MMSSLVMAKMSISLITSTRSLDMENFAHRASSYDFSDARAGQEVPRRDFVSCL